MAMAISSCLFKCCLIAALISSRGACMVVLALLFNYCVSSYSEYMSITVVFVPSRGCVERVRDLSSILGARGSQGCRSKV